MRTGAATLLGLLAGCALRDARVSASSCATSEQCSHDDVCFVGECRAPASNLSIVRVEVRPPSGSPFAMRSLSVDIQKSVLNDFALAVPLSVGAGTGNQGTVTQAQEGAPAKAIAGATVTFTDHAPAIPDRVEQVVSVTDPSGAYTARIPQGTWDVLVQPPPPLPPLRFGAIDTASPALSFVLPATDTLPLLDGGVTANGQPLPGASITAVDDNGGPLSAAALSQPDGGYALYLTPTVASFPLLQIGPPADADAGVGLAVSIDPFPTYQPIRYAPALDLVLPSPATLTGRVLDGAGNAVTSARVYARSVGGDWTLARSVVVDPSGAYALTLRTGTYLVEAAPPADPGAPALSVQQQVAAPGSAVDLVCPAKLRRYGQVLGPDGRPVGANFQVIATRLADALLTTRTAYTTPTDSNGIYHLVADGGRWRFEIVPPPDSTLPRNIVQFDLDPADPGETALPQIRISSPLQAVGTVTGSQPGAASAVVSGAQVSFFALDASGHSVFLGSGLTDAQGRYQAILPDVAQASAANP
ncbi:MAG TPA: carboxypeptidase-like regulatory domain-containing protein [Myxococcales bacterium]|nr:carboxypeptidase-like regulatory domain-containing protein [Myxococcales bacterium]